MRRRDLAALGVAMVTVPLVGLPGGTASAAPAATSTRRTPGSPTRSSRIRLRADGGGAAVDVALVQDPGTVSSRNTGGTVLRTAELRTDSFALLGVTWGAGHAQVRGRVRSAAGEWGRWFVVPPLCNGPGAGGSRHATEPFWVGDSTGVQIEVTGAAQDPVLTLIDPGPEPSAPTEPSGREVASERPRRRSLRPRIRSRRSWGANERWTSGKPKRIRTVQQVHVHHTATGNDYRKRDVPRLLRAIYRYHTKTLGWSDIGYNFLVDRFGRIWAGRRDPDREIMGAHTLGFNNTSVGIAVLGSMDVAVPEPRVLAGVAKVAAWKLKKYDRDPLATAAVKSHGSDLYPLGTWVELPVIDGHRDTNDTECPGQYLYAALPEIRLRTAARMKRRRRRKHHNQRP